MDELSADAKRLIQQVISSEGSLGATQRAALWAGIGERIAQTSVALPAPRNGLGGATKALPFVKGAALFGVLGALAWAGVSRLEDKPAVTPASSPAPLQAAAVPYEERSELPPSLPQVPEEAGPKEALNAPPAPAAKRTPPRAREKKLSVPASAPAALPSTPAPESVVLEEEPASTRETRETLREELALLNRSYALLDAGQPTQALAVLAEHRRKYANPVLAEEARAARTIAECRLASTADVRRERVDAFLARSRSSPLAERVRRACKTP